MSDNAATIEIIDGKKYRVKKYKGVNVNKDGIVKEYEYIRRYEIKDQPQKRGRKCEPNKRKLRSILPELTDEQCSKMLDILN